MTDLRQLPLHRLANRTSRMLQLESVSSFAMVLGMACFMFTMFASVPWAVAGAAAAVTGIIGSAKGRQGRKACEAEKERRKFDAFFESQQSAEHPRKPSAPDFNAAAATVLEEDMKPMAPLRLKRRKEFARC